MDCTVYGPDYERECWAERTKKKKKERGGEKNMVVTEMESECCGGGEMRRGCLGVSGRGSARAGENNY